MYKRSESKYSGRTRMYYISYKETHIHNYKGKKKARTQTRVKRVAISGKFRSWSRGTFATRFGSTMHGIKFTYINPIPGGTGRHGKIRKMRITKIVSIPRDATSVRVSTKKPRGLMRID